MPPLPSLPSLRTWSSGDLVTVPRLRADLENAVALLAQRPHLIGQCTTGETFTSANDVVVTLDSELTDSWNAHLAGSADYWAPLPGYYLCDARMPFAYTSSTPAPFMAGWSGLNNSATIPLTHGALTVNGSTSATVIARAVDLLPQTLSGPPNGSGDLIQPFARQDSGGTVNLGTTPAADLPTVSIRWVSALTGTASRLAELDSANTSRTKSTPAATVLRVPPTVWMSSERSRPAKRCSCISPPI